MSDEDDERRETPGLTLAEMLQSKRAVHKFAQGVNQKRAINAVERTGTKKLGGAIRGSCKETTHGDLAPLIQTRVRPLTPEAKSTTGSPRGRGTARKRPKSASRSSKSRSKSPKKKKGKKKLKKLKKSKVKSIPEFELNSEADDMNSRTPSQLSRMSVGSRMSKLLRSDDDDDDSIFREDAIVEEISIHEAAKTGNEEALEMSLRKGSGLTVATLSMNTHALNRNIIDEVDEDGLTPLHTAVKFLKSGCTRILLEHGADVFKEGPDKLIALHMAARQRSRTQKEAKRKSIFLQIENEKEEIELNSSTVINQDIPPPEDLLNTLEVLIEYMKRAKRENPLDQADSYGDTALHSAVSRKNHDAARMLIKAGANVNLQNKQRLTALYVNSGSGDEEMLEILLEGGADVSIKDEERATPLQIAVREGHLNYVKKMIDAICTQKARYGKIDINSIKKALLDVDRNSANILHYGVESDDPRLVSYLIDLVRSHDVLRSCVTAAKLNGNTALHVAAENGNVDIVKEIVKASGHAIINKKNGAKETALFIASKNNNIEVIKYLTKRSKASSSSSDGTPLLISAAAGHLECSKVLLDNGASYTEKDKWERTLVFIAAAEGRDKYLDQILMRPQARLLVNLKDSQNNTACHVAAHKGNARVIDILIAYGADVRGKNDKEQTPMHLAVLAGNDGILKSLYQADPKLVAERDENSDIPLHIAASQGWFKCVKTLLELESEVNAQNSGGLSPLICAAKVGAADIVSELIKNGAEINIQDRANFTALHHACQKGKHRIVSQLIDAGADVSLGDSDGGNCLDMAIDSFNERCVDAIITSEHWTAALSNATINKECEYVTPMRKLINSMPEKAHDVFNRCMIICADDENYALNDAPRKAFESENFEVQFCFDFLDDDYNVVKWLKLPVKTDDTTKTMNLENLTITPINSDSSQIIDKPYVDDSSTLKENHPLNHLIMNSRQDLLTHPIVLSLYRSKWRRVGVYSYYLNLLVYVFFLCVLNSYALFQPPPYSYDHNRINITETECPNGFVPLMPEASTWKTDTNGCFELPDSRAWLGWIIIILSSVSLFKELYQVTQERIAYFTDFTNYVEWSLYLSTLAFVCDADSLTAASGVRSHWQWQIGSIAVLLSWLELMLFIQKLPRIGIYVLMFESVIKTFLDFAIVFLLFLLGFSLSFFMLAQNIAGFDTVFKSMVKNLAMMIGEFDLGDMFVYFGVDAYCPETGQCDTDDWTQVAFYYKTMYFVFIMCVFIMTIIISNMLVGLAIDDIKAVQETAVLKRQALKIELALDCVYRMSGKYREKWIKMEDGRVSIKAPETFWGKFAEYLDPMEINADSIRALQIEKVDEIERLEGQVNAVNGKCNKIEHILGDICSQLNIRISQPKSDMSLI